MPAYPCHEDRLEAIGTDMNVIMHSKRGKGISRACSGTHFPHENYLFNFGSE